MNQAFPSEDGNFKRGAVKPIAIIVGLLLVVGAIVFMVLSIHDQAAAMTKEAVNKEILDIQLLPKADQIPRWKRPPAPGIKTEIAIIAHYKIFVGTQFFFKIGRIRLISNVRLLQVLDFFTAQYFHLAAFYSYRFPG